MTTAVPAGVPHDAAHAVRDNLGAAAVAAGELPPFLGDPLLTAARAAFTSGFHVTALVSAVLMVVIAALVLTLRRPGRRGVRGREGSAQRLDPRPGEVVHRHLPPGDGQ